jgi:hypothetical protein
MMITALAVILGQTIPFANVEVFPSTLPGFQPCEPSVAVSGVDPQIVVAGSILDNVAVSNDGGMTWTLSKLKSQFGVFGDPTIVSDYKGDFYYFHLANPEKPGQWLERIVCQKSTDAGKTFATSGGAGYNLPKNQDKQWPAVHPSKPTIAVTWTQFDKYGAKEPEYKSNIMYSVSDDGGKVWSAAQQINEVSGDCLDGDMTPEGAVPAIGRDGAVNVVWAFDGKLWFDRSTDGGKTWMAKDRAIVTQGGGWDMDIPGVGRANGMPCLFIDNSGGKNDGNLYVLYGDQIKGTHDSDVWFLRSTDQGKTWSQPLRVNMDLPGAHQFFPWLTIDQSTGNLYAVYYDRRGCTGMDTNVYVAWSTDGGVSFKERRINREVIDMKPKGFFGDYNGISASKGRIVPIWTGVKDGKTSVWVAPLTLAELTK